MRSSGTRPRVTSPGLFASPGLRPKCSSGSGMSFGVLAASRMPDPAGGGGPTFRKTIVSTGCLPSTFSMLGFRK
eukprot:3708389-Pyramimonas_sp.AAC.1